jgi:hypothetical protein
MLYIVYGYSNHSQFKSNYIYGIYNTLDEAEARILTICGKAGFAYTNNTYYSKTGNTYFINVLPSGDQYTELFSTPVSRM